MNVRRLFQKIGNTFVGGILHSPFHGLLSKHMMLITFTGRVSGKRYTTPVNYLFIGDVIYVVSLRDRTWWRNLRGGGPVTLRLNGEKVHGGVMLSKMMRESISICWPTYKRLPRWPDISGWDLMWMGGLMRKMSLGLPGQG